MPGPLVPAGLLPAYLATAFGELYEEDGIAIFGKGLGWLSLLACFVRFYADVEDGHIAVVQENREKAEPGSSGGSNSSKQLPLVLVLGLRDSEYTALSSMLQTWGTPAEMLPNLITNEAGQGEERIDLYRRGGVFCITSRILIVDLLTNVISSERIDGLLIAHAEQVTSDSTVAFIVRIYTSQKKREEGFIKGFSDQADGLVSGFSKIDKTLKALQVRRFYLYPRFHDAIQRELEQNPPDVEEIHQELVGLYYRVAFYRSLGLFSPCIRYPSLCELWNRSNLRRFAMYFIRILLNEIKTPKMKHIQNSIAAAVQACMRELKKSTPGIEWTGTDLSIENCVTSSFDRAVSRQVDPEWHKLKPQTKQLVNDLRTLRKMFQSLIQQDCVTFWRMINAFKTTSAASRHPSLWLLTPAADSLFRTAKERLYSIHYKDPSEEIPNPVGVLVPSLEDNPKWRLLKTVLGEIKDEEDLREHDRAAVILVMVKDDRTLMELREYLMRGKDYTMTLRWCRYLEKYNDRVRAIGAEKLPEESRLLVEEESRAKRILNGHKIKSRGKHSSVVVSRKRKMPLNTISDSTKKFRRIETEKSRGLQLEDQVQPRAVIDEPMAETQKDYEDSLLRRISNRADDSDDSADVYDSMYLVTEPQEPRVILRSLSSVDGDQSITLLSDIHPNYVIMYDADTSFMRGVEIHSVLRNRLNDRLKVLFLIYEASAEQKNFLEALEREQAAFERLIHHKKTMPPPMLRSEGTQEMQQALANGIIGGTYQDGTLPLAFDSRKGRGRKAPNSEKRDVAVDVREFRSALPFILHQGGMRLAPVTLTVGDFVLSRVHCVERKSIGDLFGSFASGRLYTQAEAMCKFYKCPSLLIEFDPMKSFCLQNPNELGVEIRIDAVCSKMALLTMHFPKLRILWSRSPHETLRIFKEIKSNHEEVDVDHAIEVGRSESIEALLNENISDDYEDEINEAARDMLLRLPGVNVHSARRIMKNCDSLAELSQMNRDQLREVAGPVAGQKLFTFFHQNIGAM